MLEVDTQYVPCGGFCRQCQLPLPCLVARRPFECGLFQQCPGLFVRFPVEKYLQSVLPVIPYQSAAVKRYFTVLTAGLFLLFLPHLAGNLGVFEDGMTLRDDGFPALAVPLAEAGDGTVDYFDIAMVGICGEPSGKIADEKGAAITA